MANRRFFLKSALVVAGGVALGQPKLLRAKEQKFPRGIIFTAKSPGRWKAKAGSHAPKVTVKGQQVTIETAHPMSQQHYIVRHTLVAEDGTLLGAKTFYPNDKKAVSTYTVKGEMPKKLYATSFCNKHDFWMTEVEIG
jgi:superoxide reductase